MTEFKGKRATYADLEAVSPLLVAEIIDGELVTHPRPSPRHGVAASALSAELSGPFQKGEGGPGGWIFATEPELHLGPHVIVPDIAAWRREHLPVAPETSYFETTPDWVCEILSASTERRDRGAKRRIYLEAGVGHLWLLDPRVQVLETFVNSKEEWRLKGTWSADENVCCPPFEAIVFNLADLWPLDPPLSGLQEDKAGY